MLNLKKLYPIIFGLFFLLAIPFQDVQADGIIIPKPPECDPGFCPPGSFPLSQLEIRYHYVDVTINDHLAITHIDQVFYNPNDWTIEGIYLFPIPSGAVISNFLLWMDGNPIKGEILDTDSARNTYEEIVRELRDPALLEYSNQGAIKASIFPIPPKTEKRIEIEYFEVVPSDYGLFRYIYPLNTEKFSTQNLEHVRIKVEVISSSPIRAVYSPSHTVEINRDGQKELTAHYEETDVKPDKDFAFFYSVGESEAFHMMSYCDTETSISSGGFFNLLLAPKPDSDLRPLEKDVLLILDRSGSMEGEKFFQARNALSYILKHLNQGDRFNLISFSTSVEIYAQEMQPIDLSSDALEWVNRLSPVGSTDINRALLEAVSTSDREKPTYIIFLTDGLPTEGVVDVDEILKNLSNNALSNIKIFSFGVGYDVDTYLLDSLAANHHGVSTYVLPGEQIDEVVSEFYDRISTPVLTDITLDFGDIEVFDLYPNPLPDLFAGSQILIVGRYSKGGYTDITLRGKYNLMDETLVFQNQFFEDDVCFSSGNSFTLSYIPRLWATRKIGYLLDQIRFDGPNQEVIDQIVELSIRYGIVTPYTSYLITAEMPLGSEAQDKLAQEQFYQMEAGKDAPTFGREAVERAVGQSELKNADLAAVPQSKNLTSLRINGSQTFIFEGGIWIDTAFDPVKMKTIKVPFLSDDYFALASARPNLADAFALGIRVIVLSEGVAYEVVGEEELVEPIEIPGPIEPDDPEHPPNEDGPLLDDQLLRDSISNRELVNISNRELNQSRVIDIHEIFQPHATPNLKHDELLIMLIGFFLIVLLFIGLISYLWHKRFGGGWK